MNKRAFQGWLMIAASLAMFVFYTYLVFFAPFELRSKVIDLTVYVIVTLVLVSVAYVGYIFVKTPTLKPEEIYEILSKRRRGETKT